MDNNWSRLLLFLLIWIVSCGILYVVFVYPFFPRVFDRSETGLGNLFSHNYTFLLLTQLATLLGTIGTLSFMRKVIEKHQQPFSKFNLNLFFRGCVISTLIISICALSMLMIQIVSFNLFTSSEVLVAIIVFLMVAASEEIVCRGYILNNLSEKMKPINAVLLSSLIFALFHIPNSSFGWVGFVNIFLSGVLMAVLYLQSKDLSLPIGMHFSWNFIQGPIFGFAVSGEKEIGLLSITYHSSNDYLTGGDFGIEGSCLLTPFLLLFIYWSYRGELDQGLRFNRLFKIKNT